MSDEELSPADDAAETAVIEASSATAVADADEVADQEEPAYRLSIEARIEDAGPCKKHVYITIPRADIDHFYSEEVGELVDTADVPGFRKGHVPKQLIEKRFKKELGDQVKQKVLVASLEQVAEDNELDPINEPNLDVENIDLPDEGDFEYDFEVEVRPEFDLPDLQGLKIERPVREISEADVDRSQKQFLEQYEELVDREGPASAGDILTLVVRFEHNGATLHKASNVVAEVKPVLRFTDAELAGFDELMTGASPGDERTAEVTVSMESENLEMRGEAVQVHFEVRKVQRTKTPELTAEFLKQRVEVESVTELRDDIRKTLERQVKWRQRQSARRQVLEAITAATDWDLPEDLVLRQVDNALRREILEMQQAGFTVAEIRSRENELRQKAVSSTRQALKEHFVLDKVATENNIETKPEDVNAEIHLMALQRGESPRRVRARLQKSGMIENLDAQIRERKAVDFLLQNAVFTDVPEERDDEEDDRVEAVSISVCGTQDTTLSHDEDEDEK